MQKYVGPNLFQPHFARRAIRDAHEKKIPPMLCYYAGLASVEITRWLALLGFDAVWIDWEHSSMNVETMTTMVHETMFISQGKTIPWVRVPGHDHAAIGYALDAGASIVVPQVETVEQAKHVVSAAKFGTKHNGTRSAPPFRHMFGVTDTAYDPSRGLHACLNDQAAVMIQIETLEAINNLDDILTQVPDIDIVWLGSLDARVSMNLISGFGADGDEPEWLAAKQKFLDTLDKHNKPYGGICPGRAPYGTAENLTKTAERMSFITIAADVLALQSMALDLSTAREAVAGNVKAKVDVNEVQAEATQQAKTDAAQVNVPSEMKAHRSEGDVKSIETVPNQDEGYSNSMVQENGSGEGMRPHAHTAAYDVAVNA